MKHFLLLFKHVEFLSLLALGLVGAGLLLFVQPLNFVQIPEEAVSLLKLAFLVPLIEELFFRELIYVRSAKLFPARFKFITLNNVLISVLFVLAHLWSHSVFWALLTFGPSLVYGYSREKFETVAAPMVLHICYNLFYFLFFGF